MYPGHMTNMSAKVITGGLLFTVAAYVVCGAIFINAIGGLL